MSVACALSIDGGGVKGVTSARILDVLCERNDGRLYEKFDVVVGVSTGGILACLVASGLFDGNFTRLYVDNAHKIFPRGFTKFVDYIKRIPKQGLSAPKYDVLRLQNVLDAYFGDMRLGDLRVRTLLICYDTEFRSTFVLKSNDPRHVKLRVVDALLATTAAPTYFSPHCIMIDDKLHAFIDGGVVMNNPVLCGVADLVSKGTPLDDVSAISLGTTSLTSAMHPFSCDDVKNWGRIQWMFNPHFKTSPIIDVLFDGSNDAVDYVARKLLDARYVRFNVKTELGAMDDSRVKTLERLICDANNYLYSLRGTHQLYRVLDCFKRRQQ